MRRTVADFTFAIDLLEALIDEDLQHGNVLVVCSTRKAFLRQITPTIFAPQPQEIPASQDGSEDEVPQEPVSHRFLGTTLSSMASARALKLAFCPSIKSLRAYLSTYSFPPRSISQHDIGNDTPCLTIVDLVLLHRETSEFSVQGLSRTVACAVEAAVRNRMHLRHIECKDFHDVENPDRGYGLWTVQVPLLSGSVRLGGDGVTWGGRTISVKSVASRWMSFEERKVDVPEVAHQAEDEEMLL